MSFAKRRKLKGKTVCTTELISDKVSRVTFFFNLSTQLDLVVYTESLSIFERVSSVNPFIVSGDKMTFQLF